MDFLRAMCYRMHTPYAGAQEGGKHERTCEAFKRKKDRLSPVVDECNPGAADLTTMGHMLLPTSQSQVAQAAALPARQGNITVYVQDKAGLSLRDADAEHLDQINYAFALLEDGEATGDHWQSVSTVTKYLKRHPHITGVLSVGGWGAEGFSDATSHGPGPGKTGPEHAGAYGPAWLPGH